MKEETKQTPKPLEVPIEIDVGTQVCISFFLLLVTIPAIGFITESSQMVVVYHKLGIGDKLSVHLCIIIFHCYLLLYCIAACVDLIWPRRWLTQWLIYLALVNLVVLFSFVLALIIPLAIGTTKRSLQEKLYRFLGEDKSNRSQTSIEDFKLVQSQFGCCGVVGPEDWPTDSCDPGDTSGCAYTLHVIEAAMRTLMSTDLLVWLVTICTLFCFYHLEKA